MESIYQVTSAPTRATDDRGIYPVYELGFCCQNDKVAGHFVLRATCETLLPRLQLGDYINFGYLPE